MIDTASYKTIHNEPNKAIVRQMTIPNRKAVLKPTGDSPNYHNQNG